MISAFPFQVPVYGRIESLPKKNSHHGKSLALSQEDVYLTWLNHSIHTSILGKPYTASSTTHLR